MVRASWQAPIVRLVVGVALATMAIVGALRPRQDFDLMAYVGVVHRYDAPTDDEARLRTLADLERELTAERYAWMVGRDYPDSYAHAMASDGRSFGQQLVWFRGRPAFTRGAWLLSKWGLSVPRALHALALVSTIALGALFFAATRRIDRPWQRLVVFVAIASTFHLDELAASPLADPLSSLLVVGGTLLVLLWGRPRTGLAVLVAAVLARSDNAMYAGALAAFMCILHLRRRHDPTTPEPAASPGGAVVAAIAAFGLRAWVERGSYGFWGLVHFRRVRFEKYPADVRPVFELSTYLGILRAWALEVYACEVLAALGFAWLLLRARSKLRDPLVAYGALMVPLSVARFLAFPDWDSRFFVAPLGLFFLGLGLAAFERPTPKAQPDARSDTLAP